MISDKMQGAINDQIQAETYSAYLYWQMAGYFESISLPGFANWMRTQAQEEMFHATKFYNFLVERGGKVILQAIQAPPSSWDSPEAVFQQTCDHEAAVTDRINKLMDMALELRDHATVSILHWFVDEQVEEESTAGDLLAKIKLNAGAAGGLFMMDSEMAQRVFTPPTAQN